VLHFEGMVMDRDELVAALEYWQTCGIGFLAGDRLEFSGFSAPKAIDLPTAISGTTPVMVETPPVAPSRHLDAPPTRLADHPATPPTRPAPKGASGSLQPKPEPVLQSTADEPLLPPVESSDKPVIIKKLQSEAATCKRCELHLTRKQAVFGVGTADAPVVFIGEGPGADEDRLGEPFVGPAGKLLDKMLSTIGFSREEIYIANVVKCRPPGNRNPLPAEVALCQHFLIDQLQTIRPKVIFCLGKFALLSLLGYEGPVGKARGQSFSWRGIPVIASFHPAYYLRTPSKKNAAWQDLIRLQKLLESLDG
jgi:uracil-DNA glycosylase